jgi:hypothetical protein
LFFRRETGKSGEGARASLLYNLAVAALAIPYLFSPSPAAKP